MIMEIPTRAATTVVLRMSKTTADSLAEVVAKAAQGDFVVDDYLIEAERDVLRSLAEALRLSQPSEAVKQLRPPLTRRQADVLEYVRQYIGVHHYAPRLSEICEHFGLRAEATAKEHLDNLIEKGYLIRGSKYAERNITLHNES